MMNTSDVRIDSDLNKYVWSKGIRNVPHRVRVKLSRKRNDDEDADNKVRENSDEYKNAFSVTIMNIF